MHQNAHREETLRFRPRARIMRTLGNELISDDAVALIELVKNAYDADATRVLVRLIPPLKKEEGGVEVIDNGHGMDFDTVKRAWLEPATPRKRKQKTSPSGRRLTGEKGIGRLASARLGSELLLVTRAKGSPVEVRLLMDWSAFDQPDVYLDEVELLLEEGAPEEIVLDGTLRALWSHAESPTADAQSHGTILRMEGLMSDWERDQIEAVRTRLRRLISPFDATLGGTSRTRGAGPASFSIALEVPPPYADLSGQISPPDLLEHPKYRVYGSVEADGSHNLVYQRRGEALERIGPDRLTVRKGQVPTVGPFSVELRVWDRESDDIRELARLEGRSHNEQVDGSTVRDIRNDLDQISGVSIYRDHFRILPYGEPTNDWLRLGIRRVQNPTVRISNNQVVGYIAISADENEQLVDQSNREGLQNTLALQDLRELILTILAQLEARRRDYRKSLQETAPLVLLDEPVFNPHLPSLFEELNVDLIATHVEQRYPSDKKLRKLVSNRRKSLKEQVSEIQEVLARYRRLSTLGMIVDTVLHDVRTPLGLLRGKAELGAEALEKALVDTMTDCEKTLEATLKRLEAIEKHAEVLDAVFQKIEPFGGRKRGRPSTIVLEDTISDMFSLRYADLQELGVRVSLPTGSTQVTVDSNEMAQVFTNLLDNSLHWLTQVPDHDRAIAVEVARVDEGVEVLFSDSGPGVDPAIRSRLFEPYATLKPNGVGLGLTISGEIITEYYDGVLQLVNRGPLPGATFRILLRRRV